MVRNRSTPTNLPPILFSVTLFTSAGLLFWIQPLIGKTLLPFLGGTPAVWNTCLLFFQTMLLIGYVYALASSRWLNVRLQAAVHILLMLAIAVYVYVYPVQAPVVTAVEDANPTIWLLKNLLFSVGLPFFIISATNPLLQSWFSTLRHHLAVDPYFLFAASNAGSLIALAAFPLVLEPSLGLNEQYRLWHTLFAVLLILILGITLLALANTSRAATAQRKPPNSELHKPLTLVRRLRWLALSFAPSSLMLGVTAYITTDVAAVPLLWVIPLALYLLTFVLAFTRKQFVSATVLNRAVIVGALVVTLILTSGATEPTWVLVLANLGFFFLAAFACHRQLAGDRPSVAHLAEYYLWIAIGGALGSVFNVLIAPVLFTSIVEYPLAIVIVCMLLRGGAEETEPSVENRRSIFGLGERYLDVVYAAGLYVLTLGLAILVAYARTNSSTIRIFIVLGIPLILINHFFRERPMRLALGLGAVMLAGIYFSAQTHRTLHVTRNFFGTTRVTTDAAGRINSFHSGNTIHGSQFVDQTRRCEPLSYHHENGPLGQIMAVFNAAPANPRVAVIGLGVGAMAAYAKPDQEWTFYEINPAVISIARNSQYFTYLQNCFSGSLNIIEGDARLSLHSAREGHFGLIVFDAFSSDAIPVHLVTQQALDLYLSKLAQGGILAFNVSNRSLDLKPILADLAESRNLICIAFDDLNPGSFEGKHPSQWLVMARSPEEISNLTINSQWDRLNGRQGERVWTDQFSNILRAIKWQ
jgi:spermidine synthase